MADDRRVHSYNTFRANGSAAYDVRYLPGTSAPEILRPGRLPEDRPRPAKRVRVRQKTAIAPFSVFGMLAAACMLILVIFGYVQLYEATSTAAEMQSKLDNLTTSNQTLRSKYEGSINLSEIETKAAKLGMTQPSSAQTVYLNLSGSDCAEILTPHKTNPAAEVVEAVRSSISSLVSYLSGK